MVGGLLVGLSGVLAASRFDAPDPTYGTGFEFQVITGVLLGGVSFAGGEGSVFGAMLGVLALSLIDAGLVALGIDPFYSDVAGRFGPESRSTRSRTSNASGTRR